MLSPEAAARWRLAAPFAITGAAAIIGGGLLAAAVARHPTQTLVWLSAYLVLVVGVAQLAFGTGQVLLATRLPGARWIAAEWLALNLGNLGVTTGTLARSFALVSVGTLLFAAAIAGFLAGTRVARRSGWLLAYRAGLALIFVGSLVGLGLAAAANLR